MTALYVKEQTSEDGLADFDRDKRNKLLLILLADLFGMKPTLQREKDRFRVIGKLRMMYPDIFDVFLSQHIANLKSSN